MHPLPREILHLPYEPGAFRMAMGLTATTALLEIDDRYPDEMTERRHLLATRHAEVFAAIPTSDAARAETLALVAHHLATTHPVWFTRDANTLHNHLTGERWSLTHPPHDPLELAGRLIQEDLCLIDVAGPAPILTAAILCAPSRWRLAEKIGRPLATIHAPVPLYADRLAAPVDRFMQALRPGRIAQRLNWSIVDDGALFQLGGKFRTEPDPAITPDHLYLRVERQTLVRLPATPTVLFTIRVHSYPLARVVAEPGAAATLAAAIRAMPNALAAYKSLPAFRDTLLAHLAGY